MSDIAIKVENLSKMYRIGDIGTVSLGTDITSWWAKVRGKEDPFSKIAIANDRSQKATSDFVLSLSDINFEIKKGDAVGIIGKNGAGKSTLLKILSRTTSPTTGKISINGRVASLLEVGTGFHGDLTGKENIYMNGAILGMTRNEITTKLEEIIEFSGVSGYIDTPVKRYSSGMYVRLAFAVAAHLDPDIMIVDEVLAVGDAEFQKKCLGKMKDVNSSEGRTVIFVSHNMGAIAQLCSSAIFLKNGGIAKEGKIDEIISYYLKSSYSSECQVKYPTMVNAKGQFLDIKIVDVNNELKSDFPTGKSPVIHVEYLLNQNVTKFHVAVIVYDQQGNHLFSTADTDLNLELLEERKTGRYKVKIPLPSLPLNTGSYNISLGMGIVGGETFHRVDAVSFNIVDVGDFGTGKEDGRRKGLLLAQAKWEYLV